MLWWYLTRVPIINPWDGFSIWGYESRMENTTFYHPILHYFSPQLVITLLKIWIWSIPEHEGEFHFSGGFIGNYFIRRRVRRWATIRAWSVQQRRRRMGGLWHGWSENNRGGAASGGAVMHGTGWQWRWRAVVHGNGTSCFDWWLQLLLPKMKEGRRCGQAS